MASNLACMLVPEPSSSRALPISVLALVGLESQALEKPVEPGIPSAETTRWQHKRRIREVHGGPHSAYTSASLLEATDPGITRPQVSPG